MKLIHVFSSLLLVVSACHCLDFIQSNNSAPITSTTTTSTTRRPTTTTTPKPTTARPSPTPAPTPKPTPTDLVHGNITDGNRTVCLRYQFKAQMNLWKKESNETISLDLPANAKVESDRCLKPDIEMFWFKFGDSSQWQFKLGFSRNDASVYLSSISLVSLNSTKTITNVYINLTDPSPNFLVDLHHSYFCANNVTIKDENLKSSVQFSELKIQAFMKPSQNGTFSEEHNCINEISDVVPIAVGAALTSLVIIVMIAYFIGRRRSRRSAYHSM
ncbi:Lysosome-associated membrane glycoprotein 1 [Sarcoptes scabiei]|uniref:Lysosome-associated membrane glycoprotein (Lamp)-like protein n=1 Tax=Sarcoptes scabiei TaxID=52283 RepID=A0A132A0T5_SARSC|nr:Lysosome-associated membrane glycoprotein 1 [Sarcoptes scabiei]KPM04698.1 Lysosome-associated membrane glycoprotein (Lamp)-like protein [Sarcoptes scabiei]UXI19945.1 SCY1-like protein 2 [Sarcoptes scabiei]